MIRSFLTATLLLLCSPAFALPPIHEWEITDQPMPTRRQFINLLQRHGIKITYQNGCGRSGKSLAVYNSTSNTMCLPNSSRDFDESLSHEGVHALQDCLSSGGINDSRMVTFHSYLKDLEKPGEDYAGSFKASVKDSLKVLNDIGHIQKLYTPGKRDLEAEAYALEHNPQFVYKYLNICLTNS